MKIYPLHVLTPRLEAIPSLDEVCTHAKDDFQDYNARGWYDETAKPGMYIYRIESKGRQHTGILAANDVEDYHLGHIKKHEKTLAAREAEYHLLLRQWRAVIKPVLMTYPENPVLSAWIMRFAAENEPVFQANFGEEREKHFLWAITDAADVNALTTLFAEQIPDVYIADGHHRTSTIANFSGRPEIAEEGLDFRRIFCAYFADDQLDILGYHRVLRLDTPESAATFVEKLQKRFSTKLLDHPRLPLNKREIIIISGHQAWSLDLSGEENAASVVLDATLLNDLVLKSMADIEDVRKDKRIIYPEGGKGLDGVCQLVKTEPESLVGFVLYPVAFSDLFDISDRGESLPPKSTWFEPRIKSGLMVHGLDFK